MADNSFDIAISADKQDAAIEKLRGLAEKWKGSEFDTINKKFSGEISKLGRIEGRWWTSAYSIRVVIDKRPTAFGVPLVTMKRIEEEIEKGNRMKTAEKVLLLLFGIWIYTTSLVFVSACIFKPIPPSGTDIAKYAVGQILGIGVGAVIGYFFGASRQQSKQSEVIQELSKPIELRVEELKQKGVTDADKLDKKQNKKKEPKIVPRPLSREELRSIIEERIKNKQVSGDTAIYHALKREAELKLKISVDEYEDIPNSRK